MTRRHAVNLTACAAATLVAALTLYISYVRLKQPETLLDWVAFILSGLTTGLITFFVVWGHFQKDPLPARHDGGSD